MAVIALSGSAFFVFDAEQQITQRGAALRTLDMHTREAARALADVRAAQQAYVAAGQGIAFWMPKVAALLDSADAAVDTLRTTAVSGGARTALMEAAAAINDFRDVDKRAHDYVTSGQSLMAADVVFTEGGQTASAAEQQVETAGVSEHESFDTFEANQRKLQLYALSGAATMSMLAMLLLVAVPASSAQASAQGSTSSTASVSSISPAGGDLSSRETGRAIRSGHEEEPRARTTADPSRLPAPALKAAAELCTEFGRIRHAGDLTSLLARAADAMDATGLIVWIGSSVGADLRPAITHGYPAQTLSRMPTIARTADNAVAAAYRTATLQVVVAGRDGSAGAVVTPLIAPDGCIGALTAEIRGGAEISDTVQSLAAIFAAQLSGMLAASSAAAEPAGAEIRAANS